MSEQERKWRRESVRVGHCCWCYWLLFLMVFYFVQFAFITTDHICFILYIYESTTVYNHLPFCFSPILVFSHFLPKTGSCSSLFILLLLLLLLFKHNDNSYKNNFNTEVLLFLYHSILSRHSYYVYEMWIIKLSEILFSLFPFLFLRIMTLITFVTVG